MRIFVDMDNTLNKMYISYNETYKKLFNKELALVRENLTTYYIHQNTGDDEQLESYRKYKIFNTPGFWQNIPIYEDAVQVMKRLCDKHDVYILTAPWILAGTGAYNEKRIWIENYLPFFDINKVIFTKYKFLLQGDIIIDDCPEHLINNSCKWKIKMWYPFNEHIPGINAKNWIEIENHVNNIKEFGDKYGRISQL
ncbi:MAG: 5' nucleotidase, NT5C type [bacterium]